MIQRLNDLIQIADPDDDREVSGGIAGDSKALEVA